MSNKIVKQLIKSICELNSNATPEILSSFSEEELRDYLRQLTKWQSKEVTVGNEVLQKG
jgi:hypothetical protein